MSAYINQSLIGGEYFQNFISNNKRYLACRIILQVCKDFVLLREKHMAVAL